MEPVTTTAVILAIIVGVCVEFTTKGISQLFAAMWRRLRRGTTTESAQPVSNNRRDEAAAALLLNVSSTNRHLRGVIEHAAKGMPTYQARERLDNTREEFAKERPRFVVLGDTGLIEAIECWHQQIEERKQAIADEERAWTYAMSQPTAAPPPEMIISPTQKRIGEYQPLLEGGEKLEQRVRTLTGPPQPQPPSPEVRLARERVASRLLMTVGQLETVDHWLGFTRLLNRAEEGLVEIERLANEYSLEVLQDLGNADIAKSVIGYFQDVRGTIRGIRELARAAERVKAAPNRDDLLAPRRTELDAAVAANIRAAKYLAEQIKAL